MIDKHLILEGLEDELVRVISLDQFVEEFDDEKVAAPEHNGIVGRLDRQGDRYYVLDEDEDPAHKVVARKFHIENVRLVYNGIYQPVIVLHNAE